MGKDNACFHCGADCGTSPAKSGGHHFCCQGCKVAFEILNEKNLCQYYDLENAPGNTPVDEGFRHRYAYLDDDDIQKSLIQYKDHEISKVVLTVPGMHCASCVWILERLFKIRNEVSQSRVDFLKKQCSITFHHNKISLREVVELLVSIGYEPQINLQDLSESLSPSFNRSMIMKLGVAAFSFGNIMLLSLPEYFDQAETLEGFQWFFRLLNILLALPVLLYSSTDYFRSAFTGIKKRFINIDIPISIGISALFLRSVYEILLNIGPGFMDSFTGLVFLLLVGKVFQQKSFDSLSFERDYRSFFPSFVMKNTSRGEVSIPLSKLTVGDRIIVRNNEIIPADSILLKNNAQIDYSFVTGESKANIMKPGDKIYAGGRLVGISVEIEVIRDVSQSYLTQLWNQDKADLKNSITSKLDRVSKYFTLTVLSIAALAGGYWFVLDVSKMAHVITSILIIACPCALALSAPFTLGNTIRIFGRQKFYLKNSEVVEQLSHITHIVFDKTGTITHSRKTNIQFIPAPDVINSEKMMDVISSLASQSSHPLSRQISSFLSLANDLPVSEFQEISGKGIFGKVNGNYIQLGSADYCGIENSAKQQTNVHVKINEKWIGYFVFTNHYRQGLSDLVNKLKPKYTLSVLTGDNDSEAENLNRIFDKKTNIRYNQSPFNKRDYIQQLQTKGERVAMIGDGLNDAGALGISDVGISISEDVYLFSPASDAILEAREFQNLHQYFVFSGKSMTIISASILISFLYNIVGISFAVQGLLSPLISAILMPISSISVIAFSTISIRWLLRKQNG